MDEKVYEAAALRHELIADSLTAAFKIVAEFVRERRRVLTGGLAIDLALRLQGRQLYPDEMAAFPDYDFVSPDCVGDSQDIADRLHAAKLPNISAIGAMHVQTRRVRVDNRPVADVTYVPPALYARIPWLEIPRVVKAPITQETVDKFGGLRFVHPWYQRMDQHLALSRPYVGPPREMVFLRLKKDIARFNLLAEAYQTPPDVVGGGATPLPKPVTTTISAELMAMATAVHGHAAYAQLATAAMALAPALAKDPRVIVLRVTPAAAKGAGAFVFEALLPRIDLLVDVADDARRPPKYTARRALMDLIPDSWEMGHVRLWRFTGTLVSAAGAGAGHAEGAGDGDAMGGAAGSARNPAATVLSAQYVLMYMLTHYFFGDPATAHVHMALYRSLLAMVDAVAELYPDVTAAPPEAAAFLAPATTVGTVNLSEAQMVAIIRMRQQMGEAGAETVCLPNNYWPATSRAIVNYDYAACEYYCRDGEPEPE